MRRKGEASSGTTRKAELSNAIKTLRNIMRKDAGLNGDTDRIPQLAWILFLKAFDDLEQKREITDRSYRPAIETPYRWRDWAADPVGGRTGQELLEFASGDLLPYLRSLSGTQEHDPRDVLSAVFKETYNRMLSGYLLREVVDVVNGINFTSSDDIHTMAHLYESLLREMRDAAGDSGEFYTPRPVIRLIVQQVGMKLGDVILDPAAGTCGFLVDSLEHLRPAATSVDRWRKLQQNLRGVEKKPMPYLLGMMNMLLHGVEQPNLVRANALAVPLTQISQRDHVDVVVTNPPFGGEEEEAIQSHFPSATRTSETALLFLQLIMRRLKPGGHCGMVVPDGLLAGDGVSARIKQQLLEGFNLHTIVRLPPGVFAPYTGIPTNLIFFDRTGPTKEIWYYQIVAPEGRKNYSKTNPLRFEELGSLQEWWEDREENNNAWRVAVGSLTSSYNLDIRNPRLMPESVLVSPQQLSKELLPEVQGILRLIEGVEEDPLLASLLSNSDRIWPRRKIDKLLEPVEDLVEVDADASYRLLGIRLAAEGPFIREEKVGLEIGARVLNRVHTGQFIYSRLFAWRGAFGIVTSEFDGCFASNEFPTFAVKDSEVLVEFLRLYFTRPLVWSEVERYCTGTTKASRNRFKEAFFLNMSIPVPSLDVQQILVKKATEMKHLAEDAKILGTRLDSLNSSLLGSFFHGEL